MFQQLANNIRSIDPWEVYKPILEKYFPQIIEWNKEQLFKGQTSLGDKIHPNYFEDDYFPHGRFKSGKQYAIFKKKLQEKTGNNPFYNEKGFSTPDFFITGSLVHDQLKAYFKEEGIIIEPNGEGASFDSKYKNIYGVQDEHIDKLIEMSIDEYNESIYEKIMEGV